MDGDELVAFLNERIHGSVAFAASVGVVFEQASTTSVRLRLPFRADLLTGAGRFHGGAVATALDIVAATAAVCAVEGRTTHPPATVSLTINYLASAEGSDLLAIGTVERSGKLTTVSLRAETPEGELLATGSAVIRLSLS